LRQLLGELHCGISKATVAYCDNISVVYMSSNPVHHKRMKHIELDIPFVRERVSVGDLRVLHVPIGEQYADVMTKGLPTATFEAFRSSLCVVPITHHGYDNCRRLTEDHARALLSPTRSRRALQRLG
jgi:hypothetical protein